MPAVRREGEVAVVEPDIQRLVGRRHDRKARRQDRRLWRGSHEGPRGKSADRRGARQHRDRHRRESAGRRRPECLRLGGRRRGRVVDLQSSAGRRIESSLAILFQTPPQQSADRHRRVGRQDRPVRLAFENRDDGVGDRVAGEWGATREHFVEHAAERPDIRPPVQRLATRLFGAHVCRGTQDESARR